MSSIAGLPKKGLKVAHLNICSLRNKINDIEELLTSNSVHILAISETHLDESFSNAMMSISGFNMYRRDRNCHGGGVAFYVQDHIPVKVREDLEPTDIEIRWLQIHLPYQKDILIGCCYRPPSANIGYMDEVNSMLDQVYDLSMEVILTGDLNVDWLLPHCPLKQRLMNIANSCSFKQMVKQPTRISINKKGITTSSCIDHIYVNRKELYSKAISVPVGYSDHNLVAIARKGNVPKAKPRVILTRIMKRFSEEAFLNDICKTDWSSVLKEEEPDVALNVFMSKFVPVIDQHAPVKKMTVRTSGAPWMDEELKQQMALRNEAKATANKTRSVTDRRKYCKLRNSVTKLNLKKKKAHLTSQLRKFSSDGKKLWKTLNSLLGNKTPTQPTFIENDGTFITNPTKIANHLNNYFHNKVAKLRREQLSGGSHDSNLMIGQLIKEQSCSFQFAKVEEDTVSKLITSCCKDQQAGIDNVDGKFLKMAVSYISQPICHIFNVSLKSCIFPQAWKEAKIIPLPKDKKKTFTPPNSRPISLLPALSKIFEKIVFNQIQHYFSENNLLTEFQHAYRKGFSTCTALTQMTDDWLQEIDNKKICGAVLLDFTAAFDVIDHGLLLQKFERYGFKQSALNWLNSYLTNRSQKVYFNGSFSSSVNVDCGVPQGSCLGPLLYSIFTNDLPSAIQNAKVVMYADDTSIYTSAKTSAELTQVLNRVLGTIERWVKQNKLVLNISKTKSIVFGSSHSLSRDPALNLCINKEQIEQVKEVKLLGVIIDSRLSWSKQIDHMVKKMSSGLALLRHGGQFLTQELRKRIVCSLVLAQMEYCTIVWSNANKDHLAKLQRVQNKAARLVLKCSYSTNITYMHSVLQWLRVEERLHVSLLTSTWAVLHNKMPLNRYNLLCKSCDIHTYNTRHAAAGRLSIPKSNTNAFLRTVEYRSIKAWNNLPTKLTILNSKVVFKKQVKKHLSLSYIN